MRAIIVAYGDGNRAIGDRGQIPWQGKLPADMRRVRELTTNQTIIMGRNTLLSLGRPLPQRENIVLTTDADFRENVRAQFPKIIFANGLDDAFARVSPDRGAFVFGGATVYREAMARAATLNIDTIFATEVHGKFAGDAFFPEISAAEWRETSRENFAANGKNLFPYSFVNYVRTTRFAKKS